jgi:hypothetical protein
MRRLNQADTGRTLLFKDPIAESGHLRPMHIRMAPRLSGDARILLLGHSALLLKLHVHSAAGDGDIGAASC